MITSIGEIVCHGLVPHRRTFSESPAWEVGVMYSFGGCESIERRVPLSIDVVVVGLRHASYIVALWLF